MSISVRPYRVPDDYDVVDRFLVDTYEPGDRLVNWLQPRWEYMHSHPNVDALDLATIGIAEEDGRVVGVVHPEDSPALNYLQLRPGPEEAKVALVVWAEQHRCGWSRTLEKHIVGFFVDDQDGGLRTFLSDRGYTCSPEWGEAHARLRLDGPVPDPALPAGFHIRSLADENDLAKVNRVLWRGFNHEGPPPDAEIPGRIRVQRAPNYRKDLNIVVVAPDGFYASYAGIWYVPQNRVAYVEPVATDPDHRRLGLGTAAVLEALRRAAGLGAEVAWVGSDQSFYVTMGFEITSRSSLWWKGQRNRRSANA